ncbi:hypothetical protein GIB67_033547, partial [Kingdonia uniflora]
VSDDEVAFLAHGDANDENNVLSLWYDGLKLLVVTDGKKGCRYFTKGIEHLQHALEISPGNVAAYFGLAYRLLDAHLDEWSALEVDYSTSLSGAITALQAAPLRHPINKNVSVDIEEVEGALNSASNVIETMSSHFQSFLPKAEEIMEAFASNRSPRYEPIVYIDKPLSISERIAFYSIAECVVVSAVRDGMNLTPYEYIVCRKGVSGLGSGLDSSGIKKSMLVVSEFIGYSPSLSGAIRINLWNIEAIGEALNEAISMAESEKQLLHEKHYKYVSTHDVAYWSRRFMQDLERSCKDHFRRRCYAMGIGFGF